MAAALAEQRDVIEEVIEPYLIQQGFVQRTPRGRMLTETAFRHLGLPVPASLPGRSFDRCLAAALRAGGRWSGGPEVGTAQSSDPSARCGSITRTPMPPASSTTPTTSNSPSAGAPR